MKTTKQILKVLTNDTVDKLFVVSAIEYYAKAVIDDDGQSFSQNSIINGDLWLTMAKRALKEINED